MEENKKTIRIGLVFDLRSYKEDLPPQATLIDIKSLQPVGHNLYIIETKPFDDSYCFFIFFHLSRKNQSLIQFSNNINFKI